MAENGGLQDGRIKTLTPGGREIELRLSTMPTAFGENAYRGNFLIPIQSPRTSVSLVSRLPKNRLVDHDRATAAASCW